MGWKLPGLGLSSSPYRPCLQEFYADWAPEKLGGIDDTLSKYEGRERQLFGAQAPRSECGRCAPASGSVATPCHRRHALVPSLSPLPAPLLPSRLSAALNKKYGQKVNAARCTPKKESKKA